ncbi:MAG: ABC-F family ATP-binding cassette domain-containing protein [Myxococcales bacterium]|nr:ABC-F family ATP-binding cassette domain-containing protein [Myxococcales bacterium]
MSLVVFEDVSLHLGGKKIVEGLGLRIADGDRIGLIGPNGSGKTTLLRLLAGQTTPDGGSILVRKGARIGYLPQDVNLEGGRTLRTFVRESVPGRAALEADLAEAEATLNELADAHDQPDFEERMTDAAGRVADLHERMSHFDAYFGEHEALRILAGLGFRDADLERDLSEFSGGWKMRAVLGSLLFQRPDLLLLDEPTNHLDMPSVAWLSGFLQRYDRAFVLISHDREFLNEQVARIVSFEVEGVRQYVGDYEAYRRQREEERVLLENRAKNLSREKEQMERFVKRFRAKATKAKQVQSRVKKLEKMDDVELFQDREQIRFRFPPVERAGKNVIEVHGLKKSYGAHEVLKGVDLLVQRGERIALLGVNGAGKTTLLRILAGEIEPSGGEYRFGANTRVAYYAQHHAEVLRKEWDVYTTVKSASEDATHQQVRAALGALLFGDLEIEKKVGVLSGGERARVALACMLVRPGNVLLMDEPTNHLDIESSDRLADALDGFDGTLLFVSHNRAFIRRLATSLWFVEDGKVVVYPGTLDDYLAKVQRGEGDLANAVDETAAASKNLAPGNTAGAAKSQTAQEPPRDDKAARRAEADRRREQQKKLRPLQRRSEELEKTIARLEREQAEREAQMADPGTYGDPDKQRELTAAYARAKVELEVAMDTWAEVQEELEALTT